ncbi:hypothetical protein NP493_4375g00000, partial [Ridgeia piscesae]
PPQIIERIHRRQQVKTGETIKLPCPVEANPEPLFEWTKDGESINAGWERYRKSAKGSLRIKDAVAEDSGRYVCKATNGFGSVDVKYTVNVMHFTEGRWNYPCGESGYSIHPANVLEHRDTLMCGKLVI